MDIRSPRNPRAVFATAVALGLVLVLSVFGGVGFAKNPGAAAKQYEKKVTLCHKGKKTISVGKAAANAHVKHGDTVGACASSSASASSTAKGKGKKKGSEPAATTTTTTTTTAAPSSPSGSEHGHGKGKGKK
jgi:hypothetical protein